MAFMLPALARGTWGRSVYDSPSGKPPYIYMYMHARLPSGRSTCMSSAFALRRAAVGSRPSFARRPRGGSARHCARQARPPLAGRPLAALNGGGDVVHGRPARVDRGAGPPQHCGCGRGGLPRG